MKDRSKFSDLLGKMAPHFVESVQNAFETMVFMNASCGEQVKQGNDAPSADISGTIGLSGSSCCGILAVAFKMEMAEKVFRSMMMMGEGDEVNRDELKDAVGELANMIAGGAKARLQNEGFDCNLGLPTVVIGIDHRLESPADAAVCTIPVSTDSGAFFIKIAVA